MMNKKPTLFIDAKHPPPFFNVSLELPNPTLRSYDNDPLSSEVITGKSIYITNSWCELLFHTVPESFH